MASCASAAERIIVEAECRVEVVLEITVGQAANVGQAALVVTDGSVFTDAHLEAALHARVDASSVKCGLVRHAFANWYQAPAEEATSIGFLVENDAAEGRPAL